MTRSCRVPISSDKGLRWENVRSRRSVISSHAWGVLGCHAQRAVVIAPRTAPQRGGHPRTWAPEGTWTIRSCSAEVVSTFPAARQHGGLDRSNNRPQTAPPSKSRSNLSLFLPFSVCNARARWAAPTRKTVGTRTVRVSHQKKKKAEAAALDLAHCHFP